MDTFMSDYFGRLTAIHMSINKSLADLSVEALNWVPGPEMNSMAVVATHTAGSERFWIGDVAGQRPSGRVRAEEFQVTAAAGPELTVLLDSTLAFSQSVLEHLGFNQLNEMRGVPGRSEPCSVAWALLHALEHTSLHAGHIELTRQFWDQRRLD